MPNFDRYEDYARTLYIRFKCTRCGKEELEPLRACSERTGDRGDLLGQLRLPENWYDNHFNDFALCPACNKAYFKFMRGEK